MAINKTYIYSLNCPITGDVKYIGKANNPQHRLRKHTEESVRDRIKTKKNRWILSLYNKGLKPILSIEDEVNINEWQFWEMHYISLYKSFGFDLKNATIGGDAPPNTTESINKMRLSKLGKPTSYNQKKACSKLMKGNKYASGNKNKAKEISCIDILKCSITYYPSMTEAANVLNIKRTSIGNNIIGMSSIVNKRYYFSLS